MDDDDDDDDDDGDDIRKITSHQLPLNVRRESLKARLGLLHNSRSSMIRFFMVMMMNGLI